MKSHDADRVQLLPSSSGADEVELADYFWALWRYRSLILGATLLSGGIAYGVSAAAEPVYQASAVVTMSPPGGGELPYAVITEVRNLLQNASVVERALAQHRASTAHLTPGIFIAKNLNIERNRETNLFNVTVILPDAAAAADTANSISAEAVAAYSRIAAEQVPIAAVANVSTALTRTVTEAQERLLAARDALLGFIRQSRIDDVRAQASASLGLLRDIATTEADLRGERAALQQVLGDIASTERVIAAGSGAGGPESVDGAAGNRQYLNPAYPTLQARAADARARIASLEQRRASLVADQTRFAKNGASLASLELQLAALRAAYDRAADVELDARTRLDQALNAANPPAPLPARVSVTERATAPSSPIAPKPARSLMLGLALGALVSVLLALALDAIRVQRLGGVDAVGVR